METASPLRPRGLEDLCWSSLTRQEKLVVASLLERPHSLESFAHLGMIAADLRDDARLRLAVPLAFTAMQNRAVARALEAQADEIEGLAEAAENAAVGRTGHYAAGFVRSLVDRLVKADPADEKKSLERISQLLLVERPAEPQGADSVELVARAFQRLDALGLGTVFWPVLEQYAEEAARLAAKAGPAAAPDDDLYDFEIVDSTEQRRALARAAFERALEALWNDDSGWVPFLKILGAGTVCGCAAAMDEPLVAANAANTAFAIAGAVREHLIESRDRPWDAVRPGLKAILDRYPALKRFPMLKAFVRHQLCQLYPSAALLE